MSEHNSTFNELPPPGRELERLRERIATLEIALKRADGALANAACVPTGDIERGIRLLTERIRALEAALASTHFHHKAFMALCPRCQGSLPGHGGEG